MAYSTRRTPGTGRTLPVRADDRGARPVAWQLANATIVVFRPIARELPALDHVRGPYAVAWSRPCGPPPSTSVEPPAAVIFAAAEALNACAVTCKLTPPRSPEPSTLTGRPARTAPAWASS